ncbi:hypothetical protein Hdeb2414_s0013g00405031 [Helianthus debilis subsp. tardiflorus]
MLWWLIYLQSGAHQPPPIIPSPISTSFSITADTSDFRSPRRRTHHRSHKPTDYHLPPTPLISEHLATVPTTGPLPPTPLLSFS